MARMVAQVYNWWSIFTRLAVGHKHLEAITSRPLMLYAVGKQARHSRKNTLKLTSAHSKSSTVRLVLSKVSRFLSRLYQNAEQLTDLDRWRLILSAAFRYFLRGRPLASPKLLPSG